MVNLVLDPNIPYVGPIGGGGKFSSQKLVRIEGTVPAISYRFNINLQCGPCTSPHDDVALQISVRLLDGCICLNSLYRGIWDKEQKNTAVPIKCTERFEIVILCEFSKYKVAINGQHYCEFPQRIHYDKISYLSIEGDVSIIKISYESAGEVSAAGPSLTMPVASTANGNNDFEILDNSSEFSLPFSGPRPPTSGFYSPPTAGYPPPKNSYLPNNYNIYTSTNLPTYEEALGGPPDPTRATTMHPQPIQPTYVSALQPPPGTTIPLNAVGSNFRPVTRNNSVKIICTLTILTVMFIIMIMMLINIYWEG